MSLSFHVLCFVCWGESCPCLTQFFGHQLERIETLGVSKPQAVLSFLRKDPPPPACVPYHLLYTEGKLLIPLPQVAMNRTEPPAKNKSGSCWGHQEYRLSPYFDALFHGTVVLRVERE